MIPLSDVRVELRLPGLQEGATESSKKTTKGGKKDHNTSSGNSITVELVPGGKAIEYEKREREGEEEGDGVVLSFVVPRVAGHQMVCLSFK